MNKRFKNAAHDAAGTAIFQEKTIFQEPSPTNPATAGEAGHAAQETHAGRASFDSSPSGERDVPLGPRNPAAGSTSRDNPAFAPGDQAISLLKPTAAMPVPENTATVRLGQSSTATQNEGADGTDAGDDAMPSEKSIVVEHHPEIPATAGGKVENLTETHFRRDLARTPARDGGGDAPIKSRDPIKESAFLTHPASAGEAGHAAAENQAPKASFENSPKEARGVPIPSSHPAGPRTSRNNPLPGAGDDAIARKKPKAAKHHPANPATVGGKVQCSTDAPVGIDLAQIPASNGGGGAPRPASEPLSESASPTKSRRKAGEVGADQSPVETQTNQDRPDLRFSDPLIAEIVQLHRMRRRWMKAKNALVLQGKAFGRSVCNGDKDAGTAAFNRVMEGKNQPGDEVLVTALMPFKAAISHFDESIEPIEKRLEKLAKKLPIAPWVKTVTGLGWRSVATIVGEAGDLSQYPSVAGVWKYMGLAVIKGGRQRKVADKDEAILHGYNPGRRAVVWVMADSMAKHQRTWFDKQTGEVKKPAGTFGRKLESEKLKALEAGCNPLHAERRGKRHMSKEVLKHMTLQWCKAVGHTCQETHIASADRSQSTDQPLTDQT